MELRNRPTIIAFCGQAGAGKSTCAEWALEKTAGAKFSFAALLKSQAFVLAHPTLKGDAHAAFYGTQADKARPREAFGGRSGREFLQELGSLCRSFNEDFFVNPLRVALDERPWPLVIDDLRYPNEAEAVRELGGIVVGVRVKGEPLEFGGHESESALAERWESMIDVEISAFRGKMRSLRGEVLDVLEAVGRG